MKIRESSLVVIKSTRRIGMIQRVIQEKIEDDPVFEVRTSTGNTVEKKGDDLIWLADCAPFTNPEDAFPKNIKEIVVNLALNVDRIQERLQRIEGTEAKLAQDTLTGGPLYGAGG